MLKHNVQSETLIKRRDCLSAFLYCTTVCKAKVVFWRRSVGTNLIVQGKVGQIWDFLHPEYVTSLWFCGVALQVWRLLQSLRTTTGI